MQLLSAIFDRTKEIVTEALSNTITLQLDEELINDTIDGVVNNANGHIQQINLKFFDNGFKSTALILKNRIKTKVEVDFIISTIEISPTRQILTLQQSSELIVTGVNWWSKTALFFFQTISDGLLRDKTLSQLIEPYNGITVKNADVSVDFETIGISEKITEILTQKWLTDNASGKNILEQIICKGGDYFLKRISVVGAQCNKTGIQLEIKL